MTEKEKRKRERAAFLLIMKDPKTRAEIMAALEEDAREARETLQKLQQQQRGPAPVSAPQQTQI